ncbi:MAG: NAD(P)-dependent oxidoreductase [Candidatus Nanoarchaeia archaeon]
MKPKIVLLMDLKLYEDQAKRLESLGEVIYHNSFPKSTEDWLERCKDANIICSGLFGLKSDKVYELKDVFISLPFVAVDFLDKKKLKENNVVIANSPGCNKEAVSEWFIGMMLMYFRNLSELAGTTTMSKEHILKTGTSLYNKKITILGQGNVGKTLGKLCESFNMNVRFFRRGDDLLETVKDADIIANCLCVNPSTIGLLDRTFFFSLKKGSFFISAAKHQIYDVDALKASIDEGILMGAADDAADAVGGDINDSEYKRLLNHPKIIITPHIAWNAESERRKANDMMIDNIEAWLNKKPINLIY